MKQKIAPTSVEVPVGDDDVIVSKTDLSGRITYVNRTFMRISNFAEREVLGKQHNVVRHPDMPRGVYRLMWDTLKAEREFFGIVKNLTSDGHFYWVLANVTADRDDDGQSVGYFSVRRHAPASTVRAVSDLYAQMMKIEREAGPAEAPAASAQFLRRLLEEQKTTYDRFVLGLYQQ
ncbi:MAG: PAS domain S-box protein [Thauera sp.]|nr:PAS domain S-box protein [Thauera sp.]